MSHQLLEDVLAGSERLGGGLGGLELGAFGRNRATGGGYLGRLVRAQRRGGALVAAGAAIVASRRLAAPARLAPLRRAHPAARPRARPPGARGRGRGAGPC